MNDGFSCLGRAEPRGEEFNAAEKYSDLGAHTLLEAIPNSITHGLTDPKKVYVLRWITGRHAGVSEFAPPYMIAV